MEAKVGLEEFIAPGLLNCGFLMGFSLKMRQPRHSHKFFKFLRRNAHPFLPCTRFASFSGCIWGRGGKLLIAVNATGNLSGMFQIIIIGTTSPGFTSTLDAQTSSLQIPASNHFAAFETEPIWIMHPRSDNYGDFYNFRMGKWIPSWINDQNPEILLCPLDFVLPCVVSLPGSYDLNIFICGRQVKIGSVTHQFAREVNHPGGMYEGYTPLPQSLSILKFSLATNRVGVEGNNVS